MDMEDVCCSSKRIAMDSLAACSRHSRCRPSSRRDCSGGSASDALRDENLWLAQQLAISEANARHWQERVRALRRELRAVAQQHTHEREQWQHTVAEKERKWTHEYDRHMQSLLQIIAHHEDTHRARRSELEAMETRADTANTSTQTEAVEQVEGEQHTQCDVIQHCCQEAEDVVTERHQREAIADQVIESIEAPSDSIHEQYAALTMQKLLQHLRPSNAQSPSSTSPHLVPAKTAPPIPPSFRDSIIKRLAGSAASADVHSAANFQRTTASRGNSTGRILGVAPKLPVLHEQEEVIQDPPSRLRYPSAHSFLSPSAA